MKELNFYEGQQVECDHNGDGVVFAIYKNNYFPIVTIFKNGKSASYLFDGREYSDFQPSLKPKASNSELISELLEALIYLYNKMDEADSAMMSVKSEHLYEYDKWKEIGDIIKKATQKNEN